MPLTFLCITSFFKGEDFMRYAKREGCTVYLVTSKKHEDKAWPRESIDEIFYIQEDENEDWNMDDAIGGTAWLMRTRKIDRIIALDDFDVEKAALMREHFRIPGMGQTTARHFRDKLAMRVKAQDEGILVPAFSALFNDQEIEEYINKVKAPWMVKPRGEASAKGIKKINTREELWDVLKKLGNERHNFLIEQFRPGDVFHVDALSVGGKFVFCQVGRYLAPPIDVAHGGGIFRTVVEEFGCKDDKSLQKLNAEVMKAFGMQYSASHTEFIKCHEDGKFYFLETASRVGGAHIAEMVEYSSGINLWGEWARLEAAVARGETYKMPTLRKDYCGLIVSLARQEWPDHSGFNEPEVVWRMKKEYHVGVLVRSNSTERVQELLEDYANRIKKDYHASAPPKSKHHS